MAEITITKTAEDAASKSLRVSVPVERVKAAEDRALKEYSKRVKLPGFRPGKTPEAVVRKRFGDSIKQWTIDEVLREGWELAQSTENLKPIADPTIRNLKYEDGQPIEFELVVEIRPELKLDRIKGFSLTRSVRPVTGEMVAEQLERVREGRAVWLPVEGQAPAPGQMVRVEVAPIENGEVKEAQPYSVVLGDGQALPALEEQIMTLTPGQTADAEIRFPEDHPDEARRGQARQVRITLHEVKRQELPPLDDALAKEAGDFGDLDALKAAIRSDLEREAVRTADAGVREQLVQQIVEANSVPAPSSMVHRMVHGYMQAYEIPAERHDAFHHEFEPVAAQQVKRELVINAVADAEKLRATEADIDARIAQIAESRKTPVAQVYASLEQSKRLPELERAMTEEKVFNFLLSQSTVQETTP
ncbi:MAG: trigger factor [Gemmatimonadota bacterium]